MSDSHDTASHNSLEDATEVEDLESEVDPINDIIDYLVRCVNISFKTSRVGELEVRTRDRIRMAHEIYNQSPSSFLLQFGKYLAPHQIHYFEGLPIEKNNEGEQLKKCITDLKEYHSDSSRLKRIKNRRYKALQVLKDGKDYFSEKEMMYRNPLLYEQLVGQYLTDEEIRERDGIDAENLTLVNMILDTVDRNNMREKKSKQVLEESDIKKVPVQSTIYYNTTNSHNTTKPQTGKRWGEFQDDDSTFQPENQQQACVNGHERQKLPLQSRALGKQWGEFEDDAGQPSFNVKQKQALISAPERQILREEFVQEMYTSFIEGRDVDIDYNSIDNNEDYDDLDQISQDAEDKYFDSEPTDTENLEEHMSLVEEYGKKKIENNIEDPLDVYMECLKRNQLNSYI